MSVDIAQPSLAAALGRIPSGLFIVTLRRQDTPAALLASWVQQCSFNPPQLTVAVQKGRDVAPWLTPSAPFVVNILGEGQNDLVSHFARGKPLSELPPEKVSSADGEVPFLSGALAVLHCSVTAKVDAGDHYLFVGRALSGRLQGEGKPMVHIRKNGLSY